MTFVSICGCEGRHMKTAHLTPFCRHIKNGHDLRGSRVQIGNQPLTFPIRPEISALVPTHLSMRACAFGRFQTAARWFVNIHGSQTLSMTSSRIPDGSNTQRPPAKTFSMLRNSSRSQVFSIFRHLGLVAATFCLSLRAPVRLGAAGARYGPTGRKKKEKKPMDRVPRPFHVLA